MKKVILIVMVIMVILSGCAGKSFTFRDASTVKLGSQINKGTKADIGIL